MANETLAQTRDSARQVRVPGAARSGAWVPNAPIFELEWTLADFLAHEVTSLAAVDSALGGFARTARDSVLAGGKRVRPTFGYWAWRGLVGPGEPVAPILPALAALELLHAFALVHDDVMDRSDTRRGRPTAHRVLAAEHVAAGRAGDPEHFGQSGAVLIGDLCLVWADRLLGTAQVPRHTLAAARRCYDQMRVEAIAGQYLDILGEAEPRAWSVDRALRVARHKTASYTVLRPMLFGAALAAGAGEAADVLPAYERYGVAVGEAFQLRDDLLGVYGDPAVTGKPAGDDLRTGKPTTLLMIARELATRSQLAALDRGLDGDLDVARLAELVAETGAVERVERMIEERTTAALAAIAAAPVHPVATRALARLALTATRRQA